MFLKYALLCLLFCNPVNVHAAQEESWCVTRGRILLGGTLVGVLYTLSMVGCIKLVQTSFPYLCTDAGIMAMVGAVLGVIWGAVYTAAYPAFHTSS